MKYHVRPNKIIIGADSILVSGWTQEKDKLAKLNRVNDYIIGDVGEAEEGSLFWLVCKTRSPREASVDAFIELMSDFQDWLKNKIGDIIIGVSVLVGALIFMPLFLAYRWKGKKLKDYTLSAENLKKMKENSRNTNL